MDEVSLSQARAWAAKMAKALDRDRQKPKIENVLKHGGAYEDLKEQIEMARKPRMRTVEQFVCDGCDAIIQNADEGYIIQGNIYTADPHSPGGLIGNNFPPVEKGEKIDPEMVMKNVLCRKCFMQAMGLEKVPVVRKTSSKVTLTSNVARELEQILGKGAR